jgi:hypothetical protein
MLLPLWVAMRSALMPPQAARTEGAPRTRPRRSITPREAHHSARPLYSPVGGHERQRARWMLDCDRTQEQDAKGPGSRRTCHPPAAVRGCGGWAGCRHPGP